MPRVLVIGLGSIGTVCALILTRAGAEVVCVCQSNYDEARSTGFRVRSTSFGDHTFHPEVSRSVAEAASLSNRAFDFAIVCTKSFPGSQRSTVEALAPALQSSSTAIVLFQNGLGIEVDYREEYTANPIISGVVYMPTTRVSATEVVHTEGGRLIIGPYPASPAESPTAHENCAHRLADILSAGGAIVDVQDDVQAERWKKIVANGSWNPVCALSRCRDAAFLETSQLAPHFVRAVMGEICAVAAADGYGKFVNDDTIEFQMARSTARPWPGVEPSMMADMLVGRRMEVEAILGHIVKIARDKSVLVPRLETLYFLLLGLDSSLQGDQGPQSSSV